MENEECNMPPNPYDCWNCKTAVHFGKLAERIKRYFAKIIIVHAGKLNMEEK